jgi:hypothetical protein
MTASGQWQTDDYDLLCKIMLLGNIGVDKSNILGRFAEFHTNSKPTIGEGLCRAG